MKRLALVLPFLFLFIAGCNFEAEVPSYIYINKFDLSTNNFSEGSDSELITDAWVFMGDQSLGVFELPARVPILASQKGELTLYPGVKLDGLSTNRAINPFYTRITKNFTPQPATVDTINPSITYVDDVNFPVIEDFELSTNFTNMTRTSAKSEVFEGNWSGVVRLDKVNTELASASSNFNLPSKGVRIFLEMDYRNSIPFDVNLLANTVSGSQVVYAITVLPKDDWNKIYVDLTEEANQYNAVDYRVIFTGGIPSNQEAANIYFDNIKIVHL